MILMMVVMFLRESKTSRERTVFESTGSLVKRQNTQPQSVKKRRPRNIKITQYIIIIIFDTDHFFLYGMKTQAVVEKKKEGEPQPTQYILY